MRRALKDSNLIALDLPFRPTIISRSEALQLADALVDLAESLDQ